VQQQDQVHAPLGATGGDQALAQRLEHCGAAEEFLRVGVIGGDAGDAFGGDLHRLHRPIGVLFGGRRHLRRAEAQIGGRDRVELVTKADRDALGIFEFITVGGEVDCFVGHAGPPDQA